MTGPKKPSKAIGDWDDEPPEILDELDDDAVPIPKVEMLPPKEA